MGDNCDPNNCSRCDKYAVKIQAFLKSIEDSPHFNEKQRNNLISLFNLADKDRQRSIVRGFDMFLKLKDTSDLPQKAREGIKKHKDYRAFVAYYKAAVS